MAHDYYDDGSDDNSVTTEAQPDEIAEKKEESADNSALVPKSFFQGRENLEVGDTEKVRVLRIMDDDVEIECIKEGYGKEKSMPEKEPESDMMD